MLCACQLENGCISVVAIYRNYRQHRRFIYKLLDLKKTQATQLGLYSAQCQTPPTTR